MPTSGRVTGGAAWYGRISTKDLQDPTLSFPTQRAACDEKARSLGLRIVADFTDQESGRRNDREGWGDLIAEARDRQNRRFDAVIVYTTSRLGRDLLNALAAERELDRLGIHVHYSVDAGDPTTPEGLLMRRMFQALDQYDVERLGRETMRGLRENVRQGYFNGGKVPYGYRVAYSPHPDPTRAAGGATKGRYAPCEPAATVVREIFRLYLAGRGFGQIVDYLNRPGGPPPPVHTDPTRNRSKKWGKSTVRYILLNPIYCGRQVWNVRTYRDAKLGLGPVEMKPTEEWVTSEHPFDGIVSVDEFEAVQAEVRKRKRTEGSSRRRSDQTRCYAYRGHVKCARGHNPLSMAGRVTKGITYYGCTYHGQYREAAATAAGHHKNELIREDVLHAEVLDFFSKEIFGSERIAILRAQQTALAVELDPDRHREQQRLKKAVADAARRIELQVIAVEQGLDPQLVQQRINEIQTKRREYEDALLDLDAEEVSIKDIDAACELLQNLPDLKESLRAAPPELLRQVFDAFRLTVEVDRGAGTMSVRAFISSALSKADSLENMSQLGIGQEEQAVSNSFIAGAGFEPATSGL